ncbi:MAG: 5'/3'-nucleotidase SurE [Rikenellaceae bacterium]
MKERLIFVTNDDGYYAKGIEALIEVASEFGRVVAVAPKTHQSGMSHAITMHMPLYPETIYKNERVELCALNGTPVDCVKYALDYKLKDESVDLVLSGINHGSNSAINVLYSGTMGAAIEGSFYAPAIGFSLENHLESASLEASKQIVREVLIKVLATEPQRGVCLNVNIPDLPKEQIKGIKVCRQNMGYWREKFYSRVDPRGREYLWLTGEFVNSEPDATDSDTAAIANGYAAIVPIQVDMTDYKSLESLQALDFEV